MWALVVTILAFNGAGKLVAAQDVYAQSDKAQCRTVALEVVKTATANNASAKILTECVFIEKPANV